MRTPLLLLPFFLLLAACAPSTPPEGRALTVTGQGELFVAPEIATVMLSIQARDADLNAAQDRAGEVMEKVLELAGSLDIPRERVQSTQIFVQPEFDWNEGRQQLRGYLVQREVRIELEALDRLGELVERALRAGVNSVSPPELRVKNPREIHRQVLALAAEDARENAEALARSLGARVGEVRFVRAVEQDNGPIRPLEARAMTMKAADAEQSYEAGMIKLTARLTAEFDLD